MKPETPTEARSPRAPGGLGGALLAAGAAVLCCVGPLVPILPGLGGASALFGLDRYQPWFIGLGLVILGVAAWLAVRKQNRCGAVKSSCVATRRQTGRAPISAG